MQNAANLPAAAIAARFERYDVAIVGGGLAGLYAIHRLRKQGLRVRAFEAGSGVGGTWFWNRYPGARCDVESLQYSYSFSDELQQEWSWPERYPTQPEILKYIEHVAERFDLVRDVQLDTRVLSAEFDNATAMWTLKTDRGHVVTAPYCIMATGNLSTPRLPDIPGVQSFQGDWYHSGLWPHEGVDFTGRRVGVIGTGSSGIQMIPIIAQQAAHLFVFQRTANFSMPAHNGPMDAQQEREFKSNYPKLREAARNSPAGIVDYPPPEKSAMEVSAEERERTYEERWRHGTIVGMLSAYKDLLVNKDANDTAAEFIRKKIRGIVRDPKVAELLCPTDHPLASKRPCLDSHYFETYNRDNVTLVDVRSDPIAAITPRGVRTGKAEYALATLVFATGFDAMTGAMHEIDIRAKDGPTLAERWAQGPQTYLGIMVAGLPNLFMVTGPGSPSVYAQMIMGIEYHIDWIADCLGHARSHGHTRIEAELDAEQAWGEHVQQVAAGTLIPRANSWYVGANIPGKPRVFMLYVGGFDRYKRRCDRVAADGYVGLRMTG
ncbi:MAG: NAD(P)/FAD-dependent oxidoreductase [Candidatus Lambdaproteobacteria bacterium]|nr:NAD(P)/FAD-dependent oxidoreductase [Candidatus Lambdaproteobacteria bacterium]